MLERNKTRPFLICFGRYDKVSSYFYSRGGTYNTSILIGCCCTILLLFLSQVFVISSMLTTLLKSVFLKDSDIVCHKKETIHGMALHLGLSKAKTERCIRHLKKDIKSDDLSFGLKTPCV